MQHRREEVMQETVRISNLYFSPLTSWRLISLGLRGCDAPSLTSKVSLHSLLSRRLPAEVAPVEGRGAVTAEHGLETVAEMTRIFTAEEDGGGGEAAAAG